MHEIFTGKRIKEKILDKIIVHRSDKLIIFKELIFNQENKTKYTNIDFICIVTASQVMDYKEIPPNFYMREKVVNGFDLFDTKDGKLTHKIATSMDDLSFLDEQVMKEFDT